jgi:hypothetical protein
MKGWWWGWVRQRGRETMVSLASSFSNTEHTRGCGTGSLQRSVVAGHTGNNGWRMSAGSLHSSASSTRSSNSWTELWVVVVSIPEV